MANIDTLDIKFKSTGADQVINSINTLSASLVKLNTDLGRMNGIGLSSFASGLNRLGNSVRGVSSVRSSAINNLVNKFNSLSKINTNSLTASAKNLETFARAVNGVSSNQKSLTAISEMSVSLRSFGNKSFANAPTNIANVTKALNDMMVTLNKAPVVSRNVISMTNALSRLAANSSGLKNVKSFLNYRSLTNNPKKSANSVNSLSRAMQNLNNSASRSTNGIDKLAATFGKLYASLFLAIRGVKALGGAVNSAMDYVETYNYFNVTMQKIGNEFKNNFADYGYDSAEAYADSFQERLETLFSKMTGYTIGKNGELFSTNTKSLGLDPEEMMNFQARVGAITNSVGQIGEVSLATQKALSMLSSDLSSLTNKNLEDVMHNLTSGLIGQSRALYQYGIDITSATLAQYALQYGITKSVSEMSQAEKMQLRLIAVLDQSRIAWGDQANTLNSVANQYRLMKQQISNVARVIGNLFLPIVKTVLPYINAMIMVIQKLLSLLGFKLYGGNWLSDIMDGTSQGYGGLEDVADGADDASDAMDKASGSAKKLKNNLLGIDELNIISQDDGSGGAGGAGGSGFDLSGAINDMLDDYEKVWNEAFDNAVNKAEILANKFMKALTDAFKADGWKGIGTLFGDKLAMALKQIPWGKIYKVASDWGKGFADFLNGFISPNLFGTVGDTVAKALNTAIYNKLAFYSTLDWTNVGLSLAEAINRFFATFDFKSLARSMNAFANGLLEALKTLLANIKWSEAFKGIGDFLSEIEIPTIGVMIGTLAIKKFGLVTVLGVAIKELAKGIASALTSAIAMGKIWKAGQLVEGASLFSKLGDAIMLTTKGAGTFNESLALMFPSIGAIASELGTTVLALSGFVGALVAVGAAIGVAIYQTEKYRNNMQELAIGNGMLASSTDKVSYSLDELATHYSKAIGSIVPNSDEMVSHLYQSETAKDSIASVTDEIRLLDTAMKLGTIETADYVSQLVEQYKTLSSEAKTTFDETSAATLQYILKNEEWLKSQGYNTEQMIADVLSATASGDEAITQMEAEMTAVAKAFADGTISAEEASERLRNASTGLYAIGDASEDTAVELDFLRNALSADEFIDEGKFNGEKFNAYTQGLTTDAQAAIDGLAEWEKSGTKSIEDFTKYCEALGVDSAAGEALAKVLGTSPEMVADYKKQIQDAYVEYGNTIQTQLIGMTDDIAQQAASDYDNNPVLQFITGRNKQGYVTGAINKFINGAVTEVENSLNEGYEAIGVNSETWASNYLVGLSSAFERSAQSGDLDLSGITTAIENATKAAADEIDNGTFVTLGYDAVDGYTLGVENAEAGASKAISTMTSDAITAAQTAQDSHSPSKVYEQLGKDAVDGYVNGISNTDSTGAMTTWIDSLRIAFENGLLSLQNTLTSKSAEFQNSVSIVISDVENNVLFPFVSFFETSILGGMLDKISLFGNNVTTKFRTTWTGIKNIVVQVFEQLKTACNNACIDMGKKLDELLQKIQKVAKELSKVGGKNYMDGGYVANYKNGGYIQSYADGGFTSADIFYANENGVPELVGTMNGKTAVASNTEITGISDAIYNTGSAELNVLNAISGYLREINSKDFSVNIGDRDIARANARGQRSLGKSLVTIG